MNQILKRLVFSKREIREMDETTNKIQNCWDREVLEEALNNRIKMRRFQDIVLNKLEKGESLI